MTAGEEMISAVILLLSVVALVRFAASQWRALWIASAQQPLSQSLHLSTGIDESSITSRDFGKLLSLCDQLSPELRKSSPWLSEVSMYYRLLEKFEQVFGRLFPGKFAWATREMEVCARFVAVALDQNLAMNLDRRMVARFN
jgi:hypothetical protein